MSSSYTDTSVVNATTYYYEVSAVNAGGESANSSPVSATPIAPTSVNAVTNFSGSATTYAGKPAVLLLWKQSTSQNIVKNNVYRSTGNSVPVFYGSLQPASGVYDISVNYSTTYNYYVTAVNKGGLESPKSNKVSVTMPTKR